MGEYQSRAELESRLPHNQSILIGKGAESPRRYYALEVEAPNQETLTIGIISSHHGIRPAWIVSPDRATAAIGYDSSVTFVSLMDLKVLADDYLDGVFFRFIDQPELDRVLVLHELGVTNFDFSGRELWSVPTPDIAESAQLIGEATISVRHQGEGREMLVDLRSGSLISS